MPIILDLSNLIIPKSVVREKYIGGETQFIQDHQIDASEGRHTQDSMLFSLVRMNPDEFNLENLVQNGLEFTDGISNDFVIHTRYGGFLWEADWARGNALFLWHKDEDSTKIDRAELIGSKMTIGQIQDALEQNEHFLNIG
jgi:hypothetical protein